MKLKAILILTLLTLAGLLMTGCDLVQTPDEPTPLPTPVTDPGVIAEANLVPTDYVLINFSMPGKVAEILVEAGDQVNAGQVLARLEQVESIDAQILAAELAVLDAQQRLDKLNEGAVLAAAQAKINLVEARRALVEAERAWDAIDTDDFTAELDDASLEMIDAGEDLREAEANFSDHADLSEDNPTRQQYEDALKEAQAAYNEALWAFESLQNRYDLAAAQLEAAQAALDDAQRRVDATQNGGLDPDDQALAEANLEQARAQLRAAESALEDLVLTAPFGGRIIRIELTESAFTSPDQLGMVLADTSAWYLETNDLTENKVINIQEGSEVTISFDALPGETFTGVVESISEYFLERFGDITYVVRIRLLEEDSRLRWGMTAEVKFTD